MLVANRFERLEKLGQGGCGEVYLARDVDTPSRVVALKIFPPGFSARAIQKEFEILSNLYHPHVVEVFEWGSVHDQPYLVSEYVEGNDLITHASPLSLKDRLFLLLHVALTLDFLHERNITHLDLKPSNILIPRDKKQGIIKLLDFGMSQVGQHPVSRLPGGTLAYLSPEMLARRKTNHRADFYAFGLIAYEIIFHKLPFLLSDPDRIIHFHLHEEATFPPTPKVPPVVVTLIKTCLQKDPSHRFVRGLEMAKLINETGFFHQGLSSFGVLQGVHRDQLTRQLSEFLSELGSVLKKRSGGVDPTILTGHLRRLDRFESALETLSGLSTEEKSLRDEALYFKARLLLEKGEYETVLRMAAHSPDFVNAHGLAFFYLGNYRKSDESFTAALEQATTPLQKGSSLNYLGMSAYNRGFYDKALSFYLESRKWMEKLEDPQPLVSLFMNLGALYQQTERYAEALKSYEKSLTLARRIDHGYLVTTLLNNLANLYLRFGAAREAKTFLKESQKIARELKAPFLQAYGDLLEGDLKFVEGDCEKSREAYLCAEKSLKELKMSREIAIARNNLFELAAFQKDWEEATRYASTPDQRERLKFWQGQGGKMPQSPDLLFLQALAAYHRKRGENNRAAEFMERAFEKFVRLREAVPFEFRKSLERHPHWEPVIRWKKQQEEEDPVKIAHFKKLLEVSQKMTSRHHLKELLELIMDFVIEITGAERGFLILQTSRPKNPESFKIDVARNMDQETIQKPSFKVSRTIVQKVLRDGKPLITTDAAADPRLKSSRSIQGLRLKSILSVPLTQKGRVIGALYVENRFQKEVFGPDHQEILCAFADQAAIAIENARLYEENFRKTEEIGELNRRLESVVARQSVELEQVTEELEKKQRTLERKYDYRNIIGRSAEMEKIFELLDRIVDKTISVLIAGESGTGKELIARALHYHGPRKEREFVAVNCSAIPSHLLESELFGYVRGAFTGADRDKAGLFETAEGGTLFLDEIGDMPLEMQAKLLRALQEKEIRRLGSHRRIPVDVRIVSATNKDLRAMTQKKAFREDLLYRLNAVEIKVPPLRERVEDIPLLVGHFLSQLSPGKKIRVHPRAMDLFIHYDWPGNIRQLGHELERAIILTDDQITEETLSEELRKAAVARDLMKGKGSGIREGRHVYERQLIVRTLREAGGNKSLTAKNLGISRVALYQKIKRLGINAT